MDEEKSEKCQTKSFENMNTLFSLNFLTDL